MSEMSEFDQFVAAMPRQMEPQFRDGDAGSTAFYSALRAGWELDVLIHDSLQRIRRGGGFGVLVQRLTSLGQHSPTPEAARKATSKRQPAQYRPTPRAPAIPPSKMAERRALLKRIRDEEIGPEEAAELMRGLVKDQKSTLSS